MDARVIFPALMAVILVGSEQALLSHLFCDQAAVVIGVLVIGDQ